MRRSLRRTFSRPERPTLTSRSLQSITRPFQKRFREVFGNARILIFYLSVKAWKEKSLPKSHLAWFFLVFGEGKATKENMSIFGLPLMVFDTENDIWNPHNSKACLFPLKAEYSSGIEEFSCRSEVIDKLRVELETCKVTPVSKTTLPTLISQFLLVFFLGWSITTSFPLSKSFVILHS